MPPTEKSLKPVAAQPGKPLYMVVRDAVREAIDNGIFSPGEQMPSTKELSEQMAVSLVTAHRALQELVTAGVLQRSQGRGTFVHDRYLETRGMMMDVRLGLIFNREASIADFYHGQILEGVRQAAQSLGIDLVMLRFGEDVRKECGGYLFVNPLPGELEALSDTSKRRPPTVVVGAHSSVTEIPSIDVDNLDLARQAVQHLTALGHSRIAYIGQADQISNSRDRWQGFVEACKDRGVTLREHNVVRSTSWRLSEPEKMTLIRTLSSPGRPTAVFAAGYYFALDLYTAAATVGLRIPEDLSVVGVDDPPSAPLLMPPLTTLRQPLIQLGHAAVTALAGKIQHPDGPMEPRVLRAELVARKSSGPAPNGK
jgi:DNA-binding LacI/PurR family transcriptional regulator